MKNRKPKMSVKDVEKEFNRLLKRENALYERLFNLYDSASDYVGHATELLNELDAIGEDKDKSLYKRIFEYRIEMNTVYDFLNDLTFDYFSKKGIATIK